jgi:hypothetical protein
MEGTALPLSGEPQSSQNLEVGLLSAAHFGQRRASGLPHSAQNFLALVLSVPHFEQPISVRSTETNVPRVVSRSHFERHSVQKLAKAELGHPTRQIRPVYDLVTFLALERMIAKPWMPSRFATPFS